MVQGPQLIDIADRLARDRAEHVRRNHRMRTARRNATNGGPATALRLAVGRGLVTLGERMLPPSLDGPRVAGDH